MRKIEQSPAERAKDALKTYEDSISYYFPEPVLVQGGKEEPAAVIPYFNAA